MYCTHVSNGVVAINQIQTVTVHDAPEGECHIELVHSSTHNVVEDGVKNTAFGNVQPSIILNGQAEFKLRIMALSSRHNGCKFRFRVRVGEQSLLTDDFKTLSKQPNSRKRKHSHVNTNALDINALESETDLNTDTLKTDSDDDFVDPTRLMELVEHDPWWFLKDMLKQLQDVRGMWHALQEEKLQFATKIAQREEKLLEELNELEDALSCIVNTEGYMSGCE